MELDFVNPDMKNSSKALRDQFGETIADLGNDYKELVVLDADLSSSTRTAKFAQKFPERFFNMGIAELNMLGTAMGLAASGFISIVSGFACFTLGRAWEFIKNAAYDSLPILLCPSHAGLSAARDGGSHQMLEDIALINVIPNTEIYCPSDPLELDYILRTIIPSLISNPRVVYIRLMRSPLPFVFNSDFKENFSSIISQDKNPSISDNGFEPILIYRKSFGKSNVHNKVLNLTLFSTGSMTAFTPRVIKRLKDFLEQFQDNKTTIEVYHFPKIKPINEDILYKISENSNMIITLEEHNTHSGFGSEIARILSKNLPKKILNIGIEDRFGQTGSLNELYREYGLDGDSIAQKIIEFLDK